MFKLLIVTTYTSMSGGVGLHSVIAEFDVHSDAQRAAKAIEAIPKGMGHTVTNVTRLYE